ncbi:MAG: hypothetical protein F4078_11090 [Acidimicrobiia bacterium]|nr:hypothetical protein [Acidimicrobiia bacterium]
MAATDPTERSKPPAMMTIVSPTAAIPRIVIRLPISMKLLWVRKYGCAVRQNTRISTPRIMKRPGPTSLTVWRARAIPLLMIPPAPAGDGPPAGRFG